MLAGFHRCRSVAVAAGAMAPITSRYKTIPLRLRSFSAHSNTRHASGSTTGPDFAGIPDSRKQHQGEEKWDEDLFRYTSGRWIYNETKRLEERRLDFNVPALIEVATAAVNRPRDQFQSICKLAEGGFNRVFELTMQDGLKVIARLPYPSTQPKTLATASEVATMDLVRKYEIPTPKIFAYSADASNSVGAEYMIMEKVSGRCSGDIWYDLPHDERVKILRQIVGIEAKLFAIPLPAYGSIYYDKDLPNHFERVQIEDDKKLCVGPDVSLQHWQ